MTTDTFPPSLQVALAIVEEEVPVGLEPGEGNDAVRLQFEDGLALELAPLEDDGQLELRAEIGPLDVEGPDALNTLKNLLRLDLARLAQQREALYLRDTDRQLVLYRRVPAPSRDQRLAWVGVVERFLDSLEFWRHRLRPDTEPAAAPPPAHMLLP